MTQLGAKKNGGHTPMINFARTIMTGFDALQRKPIATIAFICGAP